jgi:hypothetical protein
MNCHKFIYIAALFLAPFLANAQVFERKHTFNIELGLPNAFSNKAFKNIMQGLVSVAPYYQFALKNNFIAGAGLRYSYFAINEFKVPTAVSGGVHSGGIFLKAGWEKFHNERFATDLSLKFGYDQNYFTSDRGDSLGKSILQVNSTYLEPSVGFILTVDEFSSYRLFISYAFQGFGYKPSMIGLETFGGCDPKEFNRTTSFLIVGFGFTHYFKKVN